MLLNTLHCFYFTYSGKNNLVVQGDTLIVYNYQKLIRGWQSNPLSHMYQLKIYDRPMDNYTSLFTT